MADDIIDLQAWSYANWMRVPERTRKDCIEHLRNVLPDEVVAQWRRQFEAREPIGGRGFHMLGGGMAVRNRLRGMLLDADLPDVVQRDGAPDRNWDDFYMGAIQELIEMEQAHG